MANQEGQGNQLKHGAIGGIALVFLVIAAAAPLGASATNTPLIFMLGNGPAAAFNFLIIEDIDIIIDNDHILHRFVIIQCC